MLVDWIHPLGQMLATVLAGVALLLAVPRVLTLHFARRRVFSWKWHVRLGTLALALWTAGMAGGAFIAQLRWGSFYILNPHTLGALTMAVLILFGYVTGRRLDKVKERRTWLPLVHGLANTVLVALALCQAWTGKSFVP